MAMFRSSFVRQSLEGATLTPAIQPWDVTRALETNRPAALSCRKFSRTAVSRERRAKHQGQAMATRTYVHGHRRFDIALSGAIDKSDRWFVERVVETSRGVRLIVVPHMETLVALTEDEAFARACDRIDKWLLSNP
jgi:hypothetical protein